MRTTILVFMAVLVVLIAGGCAVTTVRQDASGYHKVEIHLQPGWKRMFVIKRIPGAWNGNPSNAFNIGKKDTIPDRADILAWPGDCAEYLLLPGNLPGYFLDNFRLWVDQQGPNVVYRDNPRLNYYPAFQVRKDKVGWGDHLVRVAATYISPRGLDPVTQERVFWVHICPDRNCHPFRVNP